MKCTSTQTTQTLPRPFDLNSEDDAKELKNWCRLHWMYTLSKGIRSYNAPTYHDCCMSFSRKGFVKKISHPPLQSASVLKIPSLRKTSSPEDLYDWLRERLEIHQRLGKKLYFPSINMSHFTSDEEIEEDTEPEELLCKRYSELAEEKKKVEEQIEKLKEDNKKLLCSSKNWYIKYQELLYTAEEDSASYTEMTPKKNVKEEHSNDNNFLIL